MWSISFRADQSYPSSSPQGEVHLGDTGPPQGCRHPPPPPLLAANLQLVLEGENKEEKRGEHRPSWRRTAASTHTTSPAASPNQEVEREGGGDGEGGPGGHWRLPQLGGQLLAGCGELLLLRQDDGDADQKLVARC